MFLFFGNIGNLFVRNNTQNKQDKTRRQILLKIENQIKINTIFAPQKLKHLAR